MAITVENSDIRANQVALAANNRDVFGSELLRIECVHTQGAAVGDDGSSANLVEVPDGFRIDMTASVIIFPVFGAARTMDLGWLSYIDRLGATVAADPNGLCDGIDISAAGNARLIDAPTSAVVSRLFDAKGGAILTMTNVGGTWPAGLVTTVILWGSRG